MLEVVCGLSWDRFLLFVSSQLGSILIAGLCDWLTSCACACMRMNWMMNLEKEPVWLSHQLRLCVYANELDDERRARIDAAFSFLWSGSTCRPSWEIE